MLQDFLKFFLDVFLFLNFGRPHFPMTSHWVTFSFLSSFRYRLNLPSDLTRWSPLHVVWLIELDPRTDGCQRRRGRLSYLSGHLHGAWVTED